jgi:hypothetical protein
LAGLSSRLHSNRRSVRQGSLLIDRQRSLQIVRRSDVKLFLNRGEVKDLLPVVNVPLLEHLLHQDVIETHLRRDQVSQLAVLIHRRPDHLPHPLLRRLWVLTTVKVFVKDLPRLVLPEMRGLPRKELWFRISGKSYYSGKRLLQSANVFLNLEKVVRVKGGRIGQNDLLTGRRQR